jgi:uncharacterized protein
VLGALWALWHVPLFLTGKQHWSDLALVLVVSVFVTWLFQNALCSVLVTMVFHATNNAFSGGYVSPMFHGGDSTRQSWLLVIVWGTAAVLAVLFAKSFRRSAMGSLETKPKIDTTYGGRSRLTASHVSGSTR